ncbi:hypothetical protein N0V83_008377 [Neocucurbitaria cava]|uniref:Uncharacterized protein n=1 Tax=Neocucurbitaria cava TaxID=798079 RepID=A0A9W8Y3S5_9PLEO|nr:hypothetical protein N0V83_008377 [Neocucurbitaria cava]
MKESKRTPVPLPVSKARPKGKDTPSKEPLSQEFIQSDDDSATESKLQAQPAKKPKTTIAIHKPNGAMQPKSKSNAHAKENGTPKPAPKSKVSPKRPAPKQVTTKSQAAELSSSEESDENDRRGSDQQNKLTGNGTRKDASSQSDSDSSSDSSSDESNANEASHLSRQPAHDSQARLAQSQAHTVEFQPAQPYVPPRGFNPVPLNDKTTSKAASIFDHLDGKQVWHITAPAGVSLKELKQLAMDKAMAGEAILNSNGADYGFSKPEKSEEGMREVLVPQRDGYRAASARTSHTLHLHAVVRLPELSSKQADQNTGSEAAASITRSTIRTPRRQVKGLKMRFLPTGFGGDIAGTLGDSDSDEAPRRTAGLGVPDGLNLPSRSRKEKRKHADVNGVRMEELPSKKSKKNRSPDEVQQKEEKRAKKEEKKDKKKKRAQAALANP